MRLKYLVNDVHVLDSRGSMDVDVTGITFNSREVEPGSLFCCARGTTADGHDFAQDAAARGASALLCERLLPVDLPQVVVPDVRGAMGPVASVLFGDPSHSLRVVGVTGTNGKTTTTHLLASIFEAHGWRAGVIGTLGGLRTTPEAVVLQRLLASIRDEGRTAVAMEVSSHALVQQRVAATKFVASIFTNLSQDHLDYHGTMENYFEAKSSLFTAGRSDVGIINADDAYGRRLLASAPIRVTPFSLDDAEYLELSRSGARFRWHGVEVHLRLGGRFNVANALAAATASAELGIPEQTIADGIAELASVPGRFELVDVGQPFTALVDYAHTPDGLEQLLGSARELAGSEGRVILVFGCGGDRDREKRPMMGQVASRMADLTILTSDNPRSEDPLVIIADAQRGVQNTESLTIEPDRDAAIALAVAKAQPGDVVVVAGKGHETGQEIAGEKLPFDDREVLRRHLGALVGDNS